MNTNAPLYGLLACSLVILGSCVSPGDFDQNVLVRYQEAMAGRGPQPRQATRGLGFLEPSPGATGPKFKVTKNPASGRSLVQLSLDEAIMRALANSLDIQVVSYDPEMTRDQVIEAAAQFDYIVFGSVGWTRNNTPANVASAAANYETLPIQAGIKQTNITGGQISVAPTLTRLVDNRGPGFNTDTYTSSLQIQLNQPLLRNAGPEFNLAKLRIAQLTYRDSLAKFRQKVEETINTVIDSYWGLMQARQVLVIQQELLDRTIETRERIRARLVIDATQVDLKQAEAAVETRRAVLVRARKNVGDAQDQLTRFLADAQLNAMSPYEVVPITPAQEVQIKINAADQLVEALLHNPVLEQARLAISAAQINVRVAENQTLPRLDFQATAGYLGQGGEFGRSSTRAINSNSDYTSYNLALVFEQPIGNRAALAELERQKFSRLQGIVSLQNNADQLAVQVNERIRQINTTFDELQAQRSAVAAAQAWLQALNDLEEVHARLTPDFVNLKLQAQSTLAEAKTAEVSALANYNAALADLSRITGTILTQHGIDVLKMPAVIGETPWPGDQAGGAKPMQTTTPIRSENR
jgi:outer membrane protein TolC